MGQLLVFNKMSNINKLFSEPEDVNLSLTNNEEKRSESSPQAIENKNEAISILETIKIPVYKFI